MDSLLLIDQGLWDDPERAPLQERLRLRGTAALAVAGPPGHRVLLATAAGRSAWLVTGDPAWVMPAATAGLVGVVLVRVDPPPGAHGILVVRSDGLLDSPRVMVPPSGGCWHGSG